MEADIHPLYSSDFYRILDFKCRCIDCRTSKPEYSSAFCISFVRRGNFLFHVFRHSLDSYNGCVLITKPGYERTVTHTHTVPDECTIVEFTPTFYQRLLAHCGSLRFLADNDWHSTLIKTNAETEFLYFYLIQLALNKPVSQLQLDQLVMEVVHTVLSNIADYQPGSIIQARQKKHHLGTVERAKEYITQHFTKEISLLEIAEYCCIIPFHFSRLFKTFTGCSPHQFLLTIRLKNAEMLLRNTTLPVMDVAFSSGFNSIEYFTSAFRQKYQCPPGKFRVWKEVVVRKYAPLMG